MPAWIPDREWDGQDACIVGGGASLASFNFDALRGRNSIGCNDAFRLGHDFIKICLFGDASWYEPNKWELEKFKGRIVTVAQSLAQATVPWIHSLLRQRTGLHTGGAVGWNFSTGAAAVNVALLLGAVRIFLLGFDMKNSQQGKAHWHRYNDKPVKDYSYRKFITGFSHIQRDLPIKFPNARIFNVTDGSSLLPFFSRMQFDVFYKYIPPQYRVDRIRCQAQPAERASA